MASLVVRVEDVGFVPAPPGIVPNFVDPPSIGHRLVAPCAVGVTLSTLFLAMRIYTKLRIMRIFGLEDVTIILSWMLSTAVTGIALGQAIHGQGRHLWDVSVRMYKTYCKLGVASTTLYVPAIGFAKLSLLLFYLRLSPQRGWRHAIHLVIAILIGYMTALLLVTIFACRPIAKNWDFFIPGGTCIHRGALFLSNCIINIVTDFAILLLPIPLLKRLQLPTRQKIGVGAMFTLGSLTCIVSILRLKSLQPVSVSFDPTYDVVIPTIWVIVELNLSIICGCFSALKPFLRCHFPALLGDGTLHGKGGDGDDGTKKSAVSPSQYRACSGFGHGHHSTPNGHDGKDGAHAVMTNGSVSTTCRGGMRGADHRRGKANGLWPVRPSSRPGRHGSNTDLSLELHTLRDGPFNGSFLADADENADLEKATGTRFGTAQPTGRSSHDVDHHASPGSRGSDKGSEEHIVRRPTGDSTRSTEKGLSYFLGTGLRKPSQVAVPGNGGRIRKTVDIVMT